MHGTTILSVRRGEHVVIGGDGQVTLGETIMKGNARKVRRLYEDKVIAGFAGGTADAFTLFERFEGKLQKHQGNLLRSAVELAKDWRTDRMIEPEGGIMSIGSGGPYAKAAAVALLENTDMDARAIVERSLTIAADICIYTNHEVTIEELGG